MIFGQRNYPEELGTGIGATIAQYGCALCDIASILYNCFKKNIDPLTLNNMLIQLPNHEGYASNGAGDYDLINWKAIELLFPGITLAFNNLYPTQPADMGLIDSQLVKGCSVIVGVSFTHNPRTTQPTHYVEIYRKNGDGSYQCRDPWYQDDVNFNSRYAVNGMTAANAILQAVSYNGNTASLPLADILKAIKSEMVTADSDTIKVVKVNEILSNNNNV